MRWLRRARAWVTAAVIATAVGTFNVRLYLPRLTPPEVTAVAPDVVRQLRFLRTALDDGAAQEMQHLFPEGYFFSYATYGLAWVDVGLHAPGDDPMRRVATGNALWALNHLESEAGRAPFSERLDPPYGVFYAGWTAWLRGGILQLQAPEMRPVGDIGRLTASCEAIASALEESPTPFLSAYPGQAWPCDTVVAVAALRRHDVILPPRFGGTVDDWVAEARHAVDQATGILPHKVDALDGSVIEGPRGSSQALIQRFLPEVDPAWAQGQYALFRRQFVGRPLGIPGIREYPLSQRGTSDVDSGPIILGISPSATIVAIGAALVHGDAELAGPLMNVIEASGCPLTWRAEKRYYLGQLPVADGFLVWSKAARPAAGTHTGATSGPVAGPLWRLPFQGLGVLVLVITWRMLRRARQSQEANAPSARDSASR